MRKSRSENSKFYFFIKFILNLEKVSCPWRDEEGEFIEITVTDYCLYRMTLWNTMICWFVIKNI